MSKFSLETLNQCVYPFISAHDPDVILGSAFGEDVALTRIQDGVLVSHLDPIVGAVNHIGELAVHIACNDIATSGAKPRWILALILVPDKNDETLLKQIMHDIGRTANAISVSVIGGHSGYSNNLSRPLVAVTALGTLPDGVKPILSRGAKAGDLVLVTKGIGLEGTAILASDFADKAQKLGLSPSEIKAANQLLKSVSIIPEATILAESNATAMHDVTRGGLLETLLEIAQLSTVSIEIEMKKIPIPHVVNQFAYAFQYDPLKMISSGTLVATLPPANLPEVQEKLKNAGIPHAVIGQVTSGKGVVIQTTEGLQVHEESHPEEDELARMWELYAES